MIENKLNKKYYVWIWIGLFVASLVRNIYPIYNSALALAGAGRSMIAVNVLYFLFLFGIVPVAVCVICAWVMYAIAFRRYLRFISRNDFCHYVMAFTAVSFMLMGFIEAFAILEPNVYAFTNSLFGVTIQFGAMIALFFAVIVKKYNPNPVEKARSFRLWFVIYLVLLGLEVFSENGLVIAACTQPLDNNVVQILEESGYKLVVSELQMYVSIAAIILYVVDVIVVVVINVRFQNEARSYQNPETREEYMQKHSRRYGYDVRDDVHDTYGDEFENTQNKNASKDKENVFDEFDI